MSTKLWVNGTTYLVDEEVCDAFEHVEAELEKLKVGLSKATKLLDELTYDIFDDREDAFGIKVTKEIEKLKQILPNIFLKYRRFSETVRCKNKKEHRRKHRLFRCWWTEP